MPQEIYITSRIRTLVVSVLALVVLFLCTWSIVVTRGWIDRPFPGFLLMKNNIVPIFWLSDWEGFQKGIKFGDRIEAVNGQPVNSSDKVQDIVRHTRPGTILTYDIARGIGLKEKLQLSVPVSLFTIRDYLIILFVPMFIGLFIF